MKALLASVTFGLGLFAITAVHAQAPASAPAGSTGLCKDGTYYSGDTKKGACHGHQGVKDWYGAPSSATTSTKSAATPTPAAAPAATTKPAKPEKAATTAVAPTGAAPAGATGLCNDGTYYSGDTKKGACRGHKGVKDWYGATAATTPAAPAPMKSAAPAVAAAPAAMPTMPAKSAPTMPAATPVPTRAPAAAPTMPAAGGGNGKVWVNTPSKVYHCQGDRYYGNTKEGEYMTESEALAKGAHAAHGKACSS